MPNLRVISDNAAERATITSSDTAANFDPATLRVSRKSDVWRSAATTARLTGAWTTLEPLQAVVLPFCNLSPTATMRVRATGEASLASSAKYSEQFEVAATWVPSRVVVTANAAAAPLAPDGTQTMDKLSVDTTAATTHSIKQSSIGSFVQNDIITASIYVCKAEMDQIYLRFTSTGAAFATNPGANFDLNTGVISLTSGLTASKMTLIGNGIYRCSISAQAIGTGTTSVEIFPASSTGTSTGRTTIATADGVSGIYIWGCNVMKGLLSSYYPAAAAATTRPLGYIDTWQSYDYDSGAQLACPAPAAKLRGFTAAQAANAYAFGGGAAARLWMPASVNAYGLAVDIVDTANLQGYIEASFLVTGPYWESATNFDYGASAQLGDSSTSTSNDAGDLITDAGTMNKKLSIPMSKLSLVDQEALWNIFQSCGSRYPAYVSMFAGSTNYPLEARHQTYGKFLQIPAMALPFFNVASATIEVQSI